MANLSTKYLGLELKSPVIVSSSGLTNKLENIIECEKHGAGAVVLKSLFEEQIKMEAASSYNASETAAYYPEAEDYIKNYTSEKNLNEYLQLIKDAKKSVKIPIIASVNCFSANEWTKFAKKIQDAGADAIELNMFIMPSDFTKSGEDNEQMYFDIIEKVKEQISIPLSIKVSHFFSGFAQTAQKLSWTGIKGIVLFNRFYSPDIDIDNLKVTSTNVFSTPDETNFSLRWVAILAENVKCDLAASTGIHDGKTAIKHLLAGAKAVEVCSVLYKNGIKHIASMNDEINQWMDKKEYKNIEDFRGLLSHKNSENPATYQRVQFMKHFAGIE